MEKGIKILKAKIGLFSNNSDLLPQLPLKAEYESLLTDYHKVDEVNDDEMMDSELIIEDRKNAEAKIKITINKIMAEGDFTQLTRETSDLRFSFFGNEGLIYRYVLLLLENNFNIYSFHACAMFDSQNNHLFVIPGSAGSGKTCLILRGLELGLQLFSTEMTHFAINNKDITFFKGSLIDNVRIGNLKYNYPGLCGTLDIQLPDVKDEWGRKIAIDLSMFQTNFDEIVNPSLSFIFPHIEEGRTNNQVIVVNDDRKITKNMFDNITQKIGETILLYEAIPIMGLDSPILAKKRIQAVQTLIKKGDFNIKQVLSVIGGPQVCWTGII